MEAVCGAMCFQTIPGKNGGAADFTVGVVAISAASSSSVKGICCSGVTGRSR